MARKPKSPLDLIGIDGAALDRIRLSRGFIGKSAYVTGAAVLALAVIAWRLKDPFYLAMVAVAVVVIFLVFFLGGLWFADRNPGVALLEGAELLQWRQLEVTAKSVSPAQIEAGSDPVRIGTAADDADA